MKNWEQEARQLYNQSSDQRRQNEDLECELEGARDETEVARTALRELMPMGHTGWVYGKYGGCALLNMESTGACDCVFGRVKKALGEPIPPAEGPIQ